MVLLRIVMECGSAPQMLEAIAEVTDEPVRFLLHSHNHWDHGSGGAVWRFGGHE